MKIYNTLTKKKEEFIPIESGKVRMYVCGPTVYNLIHIGNARPYIVFDTVRRYFENVGYNVNYVQNFTDVDDKIIQKAISENKDTLEIVEYYIKETLVDANNLNVKPATTHPRVTQEMPEIISMIQTLIDKGSAYEVDGTVYFATESCEKYGELSKKVLDELEAGARIEVATQKKNPMDFVLWKPKKEGEPYWESPWGNGRPGWHIECSAMSKKYLGDTIDIHAGGEDLVFPHHENEIAQSECANGAKFANYWMHNSFLNIDNKKMAKSAGNFKLLRDVGDAFGYDVVRFFILSAHYRSPLNFSAELMEAAKNGLGRIKNCLQDLDYSISVKQDDGELDQNAIETVDRFKTRFHEAMQDDFNTADAISIIFELVSATNIFIKNSSSKATLNMLRENLLELIGILGLIYKQTGNNIEGLSDEEILQYIEQRSEAKKLKNFKKADEIREFLEKNNIQIKDTREGVQYIRI
ncbi:MAG: cysteine--tRNA ligase [Epulopiscium sp. Nele67-Bin002]|nr:MAG: cysteine--tRNA ligase [Epulopiscium sp. Nele67-Bin002]OON94286.1 MAG: cysteine--tRNA ligase [Epulopiscium sp. Nele67-Bin001]